MAFCWRAILVFGSPHQLHKNVGNVGPPLKKLSGSTHEKDVLNYYIFVSFVALRPKSTAMVMAGRSVHLTTLFSWASLNKQLTST